MSSNYILIVSLVVGWKVFDTDGCMTCDFTSFSTVFRSYQDDGS